MNYVIYRFQNHLTMKTTSRHLILLLCTTLTVGQLRAQMVARVTLRHGKDVYTGMAIKGLPNGEGTYTYANGAERSGMWLNGRYAGPAEEDE